MIKLFDDWHIDADENCFMLVQKRQKEKDGEVKESVKLGGYYTTLAQALDGFVRLEVRKLTHEQELTLHEAVERVNELVNKIKTLANDCC